jgi:hypothetical protein
MNKRAMRRNIVERQDKGSNANILVYMLSLNLLEYKGTVDC